MLTGGHCCACTGICMHVGGPFYCEQHRPVPPPWKTPALPVANEAWVVLQMDDILRRLAELEKAIAKRPARRAGKRKKR